MIPRDCNLPNENPRPESINSSVIKVRKGGKKKPAWYNSFLYPTYKTRSEDFRQTFKDVPADERLIVDYSCALQREILVQGRLYATTNYLCFYANIFGWETNVSLKWKEISTMTKEKTALVIPNALEISTKNDKYFFTSFVSRDKAFLLLFEVWQNALMDKQMSQTELWQRVHDVYGSELGLTSDDDDYVAPSTEEDKASCRFSMESFNDDCASNNGTACNPLEDSRIELDVSQSISNEDGNESLENPDGSNAPAKNHHHHVEDNSLPTDQSDNSESDGEKKNDTHDFCSPTANHIHSDSFTCPTSSHENSWFAPGQSSSDEKLYPVCTSLHEGRVLMNELIPLHVDHVFTLFFTSSKFLLDLHAKRKTTDLRQTTWTHNPNDGTKNRILTLTVLLNQAVGPKHAQVKETQVMLPCSKPGCLYSVDAESMNSGVPYADSFFVSIHYCIHRISDTQCSFAVYAQIKYKKYVLGLVKSLIERNCWNGMEDFFSCLSKELFIEAEMQTHPTVKRKSRRRRRQQSIRTAILDDPSPMNCLLLKKSNGKKKKSSNVISIAFIIVLVILVLLNVILYLKLWNLEEMPQHSFLDLQAIKDPPKNHEEWLELLQKQEKLHTVEMNRWQSLLKGAIELLKQTEASLIELQKIIHPKNLKKIVSVLDPNTVNSPSGKLSKEEL